MFFPPSQLPGSSASLCASQNQFPLECDSSGWPTRTSDSPETCKTRKNNDNFYRTWGHQVIRVGLAGSSRDWMDDDKGLPGIILDPGLFSARAHDPILQICFFFPQTLSFIKNFGNNGLVAISFPAWFLTWSMHRITSTVSWEEGWMRHSGRVQPWPKWDQQCVRSGNKERQENPGWTIMGQG